jgi:hypothetical protein
MDQRSSSKGKATMLVAGTVAAILLWGFGVEYLLQNFIFISPPEISVQNLKGGRPDAFSCSHSLAKCENAYP